MLTVTLRNEPEELIAAWGVFKKDSPFEDKAQCVWRVKYPDGRTEFYNEKDFNDKFVVVKK
jgi:hypothetical protein